MREVFRLNRRLLTENMDIVMRPTPRKERPAYRDIESAFKKFAAKISGK